MPNLNILTLTRVSAAERAMIEAVDSSRAPTDGAPPNNKIDCDQGYCIVPFPNREKAMNPTLTFIGTLHTPWRTVAECPRNGRQPDPAPVCTVRVLPEFAEGLRGLEGISHLILVYWLDQALKPKLTFTPPFDSEPRGVFSTRAPFRPNPIGLSVVAFDGFDGPDTLKVRFLDCVDGTRLLDIKPYLPTTDSEPAATMGWLDPHATRNSNTRA